MPTDKNDKRKAYHDELRECKTLVKRLVKQKKIILRSADKEAEIDENALKLFKEHQKNKTPR